MTKQAKIYLGFSIFIILSMVAFEYLKPKEVNWFPSYSKNHKIPYGTYILHDLLESRFDANSFIDVSLSPYEYLKNHPESSGTYFFVNDQLGFDKAETNTLLDWTKKGNTLFVASNDMSQALMDTLGIETSLISNFDNLENSYRIQLKNRNLNTDNFDLDRVNFVNYFSKIDTLNTTVVGIIDKRKSKDSLLKEKVNIIKLPFGNGHVVLSTLPQAFTNYFILKKNNREYTSGLLSYLQTDGNLLFDNHYKSGKSFYTSPLYILLNTKELKWAYYIMLIGVLFYVIFEGKRKQRIIPVIPALKNQTLDFTRTISNMYFEKSAHHDMTQHKIQYFLSYIRTKYHMNTNVIDINFISNLSSRSNNSIEDTKNLFEIIEKIQNNPHNNQKDLETLEDLIGTFKINANGKRTR